MLGHTNKTGPFQVVHVTSRTQVSNYGTWELPRGVWSHSHFPVRISKGNMAKKHGRTSYWQEIRKKSQSPKLSPGKASQWQDRLGRGLKSRLDPTRWLALHRGEGPISKPRTQFASLIQRHIHNPPLHTDGCLIPDIPFVKKQKPMLVWPARSSILTWSSSCYRTAGLRTVKLILLNTLLLNHAWALAILYLRSWTPSQNNL